jgi:outer membrane protein
MKTLLKRLIPGVLLLGLLTTPAFAQTKIATVDLLKVFNSYWKTEQAKDIVREREEEVAKKEKEQVDGWQAARDEYQKLLTDANDQAVSTEERDRRKRAAEEKLKDLQQMQAGFEQYSRQARTSVTEQMARMRDNIINEIRAAVSARAKAGGYTLVVDISAKSNEGTPVVLFTSGEADLSDQVLSQLNAAAPLAPTNQPAPRLEREAPRTNAPVRR